MKRRKNAGTMQGLLSNSEAKRFSASIIQSGCLMKPLDQERIKRQVRIGMFLILSEALRFRSFLKLLFFDHVLLLES